MYPHTHAHIQHHLCIQTQVYTRTYFCMHAYLYLYICASLYIHKRMGLYIVTHVIHTHSHVGCIYAHTFTYVCTHTIFQGHEHTHKCIHACNKLRYVANIHTQRNQCDFPTQNDILITVHTDTSCSKEFVITRTDSFSSACLPWQLDRLSLNYKPICCL